MTREVLQHTLFYITIPQSLLLNLPSLSYPLLLPSALLSTHTGRQGERARHPADLRSRTHQQVERTRGAHQRTKRSKDRSNRYVPERTSRYSPLTHPTAAFLTVNCGVWYPYNALLLSFLYFSEDIIT